MKILITTFFRAHNYGAALQAYALQTILKENNYDVGFLNYKDWDIDKHYQIINTQGDTILKKIRAILGSVLFYRVGKKRFDTFEYFQKKYLNVSKETFKNSSEVINNPPNADIYITGSDQVWSSNEDRNLSDIYTLNFGEQSIKRISYAASIGKNEFTESEKELYANKLENIDFISVRENTAKKLLSEICKQNIEVVLDPTLLISAEQWSNFSKGIQKVKEKYILVYIVNKNEECNKIVNDLSEKTGLKIIHFGRSKSYSNVLKSVYDYGPREFVSLINNAEYVVSTSFHATAFSIIFNKKFWIVPHIKTGSRVTDLLLELDIDNRAVCTFNEYNKRNFYDEIDYTKVNKVLKEKRKKSFEWLINSIEKEKD